MVTELGWAYIVGVTLLFFFWAYGIYAFVRDAKNRFVPMTRQFLRGRRELKREREREAEREERERDLY